MAILNSTIVRGTLSATDYLIENGVKLEDKYAAKTHTHGYVSSVTGTSPITTSGTTSVTVYLADAYGDTKNPYGSKSAHQVLIGPTGSSGTPSFRALEKTDLPSLTAGDVSALPDNTTYVSSVTGTSPVSVSTSSKKATVALSSAYGDTKNPYGSKSAHYVLIGPTSGSSAPSFRALQVSDIPTGIARSIEIVDLTEEE